MEELCAQLLAQLQPACQTEMMVAVAALKESVLRHVQTQEEVLCEQLLERMQPSLSTLVAFSEFLDAHKMRMVDASSPAIAQFLHQAMS